jgi:acyl-coenzyme A synthetase/AMP-(fatty) acid ligase
VVSPGKFIAESVFIISIARLRGGVVIIAQVPKSPSGKILRRFLKDMKDGVEIETYPATVSSL